MTKEMKTWIDENPMDAENREDLVTWAAEEFEVDDKTCDEMWEYARRVSNLPK